MRKLFLAPLGAVFCLCVLQLAETSLRERAPTDTIVTQDAGAYLQTALPPELDPLQAAELLDGRRVLPGERLAVPTGPYRAAEVEFLAPLIRQAFGSAGYRVQLDEGELIVEIPKQAPEGHLFFVNTWSGTLEIGITRILE